MRSNGCGDLREQNIDQQVQLCGWVDRRRDHGGVIFIDLRDRSGTVQITVDPDLGAEAFAVAEHLRSETVLQVNGKVRGRPTESLNDKLATGAGVAGVAEGVSEGGGGAAKGGGAPLSRQHWVRPRVLMV